MGAGVRSKLERLNCERAEAQIRGMYKCMSIASKGFFKENL